MTFVWAAAAGWGATGAMVATLVIYVLALPFALIYGR